MRGGIGNYSYSIAKRLKLEHECNVVSQMGTKADVPIFENYLKRKGAGLVNGWRIRLLCKKFWDWDVVYAMEVDAAYPAFVMSKLSGAKLVVTVFGNDLLMAQKDGLRRFLSGVVFDHASSVICISRFTYDLFVKFYPDNAHKAVVINPGVET